MGGEDCEESRIKQFAIEITTPRREITCHGITQCYLTPGSGDFAAFTPAEAGSRFSDPRDARLSWSGWWLYPKVVYPWNTITYLKQNRAVSWLGIEPETESHNHFTTCQPSSEEGNNRLDLSEKTPQSDFISEQVLVYKTVSLRLSAYVSKELYNMRRPVMTSGHVAGRLRRIK